jgi:hypothetical protein
MKNREIGRLYEFFMNSSVSIYAVERMLEPKMNRLDLANAARAGVAPCSSARPACGPISDLHVSHNKIDVGRQAQCAADQHGRSTPLAQKVSAFPRACEPQSLFLQIKEYALLTPAAQE